MNNKNITVNKIVEICNGKLLAGEKNIEIETYSKDTRTLKKGDILVFNHDNKIIVHRIIKKVNVDGSYSFITKGDHNNARDGWIVKSSDVIGIVEFRIRWIGMPTVALNELLNK